MPEAEHDRIQKLETKVRRLEETAALQETPVLGVAMFLALVLFIILIANLPLAGEAGFWHRALLGVLAGFVGGLIFMLALAIVQFGLKALAEILFVCVLLINVSTVAVVWATLNELKQMFLGSALQETLLDLHVSLAEETQVAVLVVAAFALLLVDLLALLFILPLSRIAGTDLSLD